VYIHTCASYTSTPYCDLLENMRKQVQDQRMGAAIKHMWLNKGRVATIIPLKVFEKIWLVTYDSRCFGGSFIIHTDQGSIIFKNNSKDIPYLDLRKLEAKVMLSIVQTVMLFVQMVRGDMFEGYIQLEVEEARAACKAQAMLSHRTDRDFLGMVHSGMIPNCPVSPTAVLKANCIFGPDLAGVRGQTMRRPLESVTTYHVQIPRALLEWHQRVTLAVDFMFVNGVPFLVSVSRGINLEAAEYTPSCMAKQLVVVTVAVDVSITAAVTVTVDVAITAIVTVAVDVAVATTTTIAPDGSCHLQPSSLPSLSPLPLPTPPPTSQLPQPP